MQEETKKQLIRMYQYFIDMDCACHCTCDKKEEYGIEIKKLRGEVKQVTQRS